MMANAKVFHFEGKSFAFVSYREARNIRKLYCDSVLEFHYFETCIRRRHADLIDSSDVILLGPNGYILREDNSSRATFHPFIQPLDIEHIESVAAAIAALYFRSSDPADVATASFVDSCRPALTRSQGNGQIAPLSKPIHYRRSTKNASEDKYFQCHIEGCKEILTRVEHFRRHLKAVHRIHYDDTKFGHLAHR
jgi:hypothetical protein